MVSSTRLARLSVCALFALPFGGCPYSSEQPLFPVESAALDANLTGAWRCLGSDVESQHADDNVARVTFTPFDARQYVVSMELPGEQGVLRAHVAKLGNARLLNVQVLEGKDDASWSLLRYTLVDGDLLRLRFVGDQLLKGDNKTPAELRALVEKNLEGAELYEPAYVCVRVPKK